MKYSSKCKLIKKRSFGCVLYEMMTLERLFDGSSDYAVNSKITNFNFEKHSKTDQSFQKKTSTNFLIESLEK
jgi:serine/threonine protein kinase